MEFQLGELFCGPGGMALAAARTIPIIGRNGEQFSIVHRWGVDRDKDAIATFEKNLGEHGAEALHMDANLFVKEGLTNARKINALAFGFPCNSFSYVGERKGIHDKQYGKLYKAGIQVLERYHPIWFIAENVSGIRNVKERKSGDFNKILQELNHAGDGYRIVAHLYKFEEYGVPQCRHRYIIVGIRKDYALQGLRFYVPVPTHGGKDKPPLVSVREALAKLPKRQAEWGNALTHQSKNVTWRLLLTAPGLNVWDLEEIARKSDDEVYDYVSHLPWYNKNVPCEFGAICLREVFQGDVEAMRTKLEEVCLPKVKSARMSHIYRRLEPNRPSYTITGSGGGGTHVYHWAEPRALTNCERAALQSFPLDFEFCGSKESIRRQIGMAVPTLGAQAVFSSILKTFAQQAYNCLPDDDPCTIVLEAP